MRVPLKFGIPGLDELIDQNAPGQETKDNTTQWSAAIVGPDGCGKSILALHLASNYYQSGEGSPCNVLYVSTDLSFEQAESQWKNFGLNHPPERVSAIEEAYRWLDKGNNATHKKKKKSKTECKLKRVVPRVVHKNKNGEKKNESLSEVFKSPGKSSVFFLDLERETAGDDWGFLNNLLGLLDQPESQKKRHLLIVDAVEGLETFVGQTDEFGLERARRSRVAQLIRVAKRVGVHVVFIVEEPNEDERFPEQFVADLVIRLRYRNDGDYSQRIVEIEKCRGSAHARGSHEFAIRSGTGSHTGKKHNLDDPKIPWVVDEEEKTLAHVHVVQSLHRRSREIREQETPTPDRFGKPAFGLDDLDNLISPGRGAKNENDNRDGSFSLLLGDVGTYKSRLSRSFLAQAFDTVNKNTSYGSKKNADVALLITVTERPKPARKRRLKTGHF